MTAAATTTLNALDEAFARFGPTTHAMAIPTTYNTIIGAA
jgi:hypothetical protein